MKKLVLSIAIISAITVGVGAVTFAAETNEGGLGNGKSVSSEIEKNNEENNCLGNLDCPYYDENHNGKNCREGNRFGYNSSNQGRGRCAGAQCKM